MTEFRRAQQALEKMVREVGIEKMPLHSEALRPLLVILFEVGKRHRAGVTVFDNAGTNAGVDQMKLGLLVPVSKFMDLQSDLKAEIEKHPTLAHDVTKNARKVVCHLASKDLVMIYHDDLWIPIGALLPEKRH